MSKRIYKTSEAGQSLLLVNSRELRGGNIAMENTNVNVNGNLNEFDFDEFDFSDLVDDAVAIDLKPDNQPVAPTPVNGALAEEPVIEAAPAKKTPAKRKSKAKLEVVKDVTEAPQAPVEATPQVAPAQTLTTEQKAIEGLKKLSYIETYLNEKFLEREHVVANVLRTLVVGSNMLLLGDPGTGKSDLIRTATDMIDGANHFSWLVNRTSDPAELVGPYSLRAMEQDKFIRKTAGKLPEAHIAFIDEIFKCNEPTLNMLLPLINEKLFYNGPTPTKVPLISMFAASNETPEDESLEALYDRILIRMNVEYVKDSANRRKMYELYATKGAGIKVPNKISLDELLSIQAVAEKMSINPLVYKSLDALISKLQRQGIKISDRRQNNCIKIMRGSAILAGRTEVTVADLRSLVYVLWEKEEDITLIETEVEKLVDPFSDKFRQYVTTFEEIKTDLNNATDDQEFLRLSVEKKKGLETVIKRIKALIADVQKQCGAGYDVTQYVNKLNEVTSFHTDLIAKLFNVDSSADQF